ncbi:hypothetical protein ACSYAY_05940 [Leptospirillum ferriphilum]|jgi:hypothetical protein|uniref:Uncharacterized protein n=2 Tax=Leptospirillum TaxID=179 RepID=A0A2I2ME17_9BACT|nr:hypothetical protein [Leptospirillum ferriphilum]EDZ38634.1 MAG: Hypothetical protein CGL2_11068121 [Leptospirillum sp. Group II '5-way CG']
MAEERTQQSLGKTLVLALIVLGGTLLFVMYLGREAEINSNAAHHLTWPWP